jgi:hypothetical protein
MRIAISGTHGVGKSTLIDEFLQVHPDFVHKPEPYTMLVEEFGEEFSAEPCVEDFYRQLEFNRNSLQEHARGEKVIYERCPIDFLAYIDALDSKTAPALVGLVAEAIQNLDLILYLPLNHRIDVPQDEYPKLRAAVDRRLSAILSNDEFGIISSSGIVVIEARGPITQRLRILEEAISANHLPP